MLTIIITIVSAVSAVLFLALLNSNKNGSLVWSAKGIIDSILDFALGEKIDNQNEQKKK